MLSNMMAQNLMVQNLMMPNLMVPAEDRGAGPRYVMEQVHVSAAVCVLVRVARVSCVSKQSVNKTVWSGVHASNLLHTERERERESER